MKLCYRGVSYDRNPLIVETTTGKISGKYRGTEWRLRKLKSPVMLQPRTKLIYRGVKYNKLDTVATSTRRTESEKSPTFTNQEQASYLRMNHT